jgi:hypothetical protein
MISFDYLLVNLINNQIEINVRGLKKIRWGKDILE